MDIEVPIVPDRVFDTLDSSGIFSDSDLDPYQSPTRTPRTTYRARNGQIRSLVIRTSSEERRINFLLTRSCQLESVRAYLNKEEPVRRRTRHRECYDIRVQMGNKNSTVEKIRHNTIDKIPSLRHDRDNEVRNLEKELEFVSIPAAQNPVRSSQMPNMMRPMSPALESVVTTQIPQSGRSSTGDQLFTQVMPTTQIPQTCSVASILPWSNGNISSQNVPSTQTPQRYGNLAPLMNGRGNPGYASSQIGVSQTTAARSEYASSVIGGTSKMGRGNHGYASSQIGACQTGRGNHGCNPTMGPSCSGNMSQVTLKRTEEDSFVMRPHFSRSQPKKAYSVMVPPSSNFNQKPYLSEGRARVDTNASLGLSGDGSSTHSLIANRKSDADICYDICNTFWRPHLTFNPYKHGDDVVEFGSLWPDQNTLKSLLVEAYQATSLRRSVLDICKLVVRCGPVRVLETLVNSRIISIDQLFENGCSLLHLACLARNYEAVSYLISAGVSQKILDKYGRTASQLCFDPRLRRQLAPQFRGGKFANLCQSLKPVSMHDKETIFMLATSSKDYDELQNKLQSLAFDVNQEINRHGDYLIHVIARQGLTQLPQLLSLVKIEGACIEQYNQEGKTPLMIAAESENVVMVDVMLCILGANLNAPNPNTGECALHYAAKNNNVNVVNCLISRGADFNLEDSEGNRPDDTAAHYSAVDSHDVIVAHREQRIQSLSGIAQTGSLTSSQIRVTDLYQANGNGDTLIMTAAKHNRADNLLVLIEREGCHVDAQHEKNGRTALAMAAIVGHVEAVWELLKYDANPAICDINQDLPLHHAVKYDHLKVVSTILQHQSALTGLAKALKLCTTEGARSLIKHAVQRRQAELVTPGLFECALRGDAGKLFCVLEEGDFVNPTSGVGDWPIFLAADNGHTDVVTLLHQHGGDVSRRHPSTKMTVLHAACFRGHAAIVKYFVENCRFANKSTSKSQRPLDVNALNAEMKTALQVAAEKGYSKMVRMLLNNGAACAFLDPSGCLFCCRDFQGVQVLIETKREAHTRDIMALVRDNRKLQELRALFKAKFDHNLRDKHCDTPLMVACRFAYLEVVKFLLESAIHNVVESDYDDDLGDGESDTDSGTVMDLVNTVSLTRISKEPPQELVSVIERQRRASQCTVGMSDMEPDVTYTDFAESGDFYVSSTRNVRKGNRRRSIPSPMSGPRHGIDKKDGQNWMLASTGHIEQHPYGAHGFYQRSRQDNDVQTVCDMPLAWPKDLSTSKPTRPVDLSASNLFNYKSKPSNSIFMTPNVISHVCAVNPRDGRTPLHRALETGDHVGILLVLVETDDLCVDIQDAEGLSPLHLACKLGRKKCVEKLTSLPHVDLNSRTLDGKLPEEMNNSRHIINLIVKAREHQPCLSISSMPTIEGSITGQSVNGGGASTINFELLNEKFQDLKSRQGK
ncbi:uncharacterized protein LOC135499321 [Lineus longissimus]|uniref:uncharacterized protein LOC135499321 n=1 Tax=Lineus longissimus TaxID=88925 RepID=UPI002B4D3361